jgi:hypothetical protein
MNTATERARQSLLDSITVDIEFNLKQASKEQVRKLSARFPPKKRLPPLTKDQD